jgi:hypothetical protein
MGPKFLARKMSDFVDKNAFERFKKAAQEYTKNATTSRVKAKNTLVRIGIVTKSGRLSNKYK